MTENIDPWNGKIITVIYETMILDMWFRFGNIDDVRNELIKIVTIELDMYLEKYRQGEANMRPERKEAVDGWRKDFMKNIVGVDVDK